MASSPAPVVKAGYWFSDSKFQVASIDFTHFTHLFASFAEVDLQNYTVSFPKVSMRDFQTFPITVKNKSSTVKTLISIGGPRSPSTFAALSGDQSSRKAFINSSIGLARENDYDGLGLNWEYPSTVEEMNNFGVLLREWRVAIDINSQATRKKPLLLVASVYYSPEYSSLKYPIEVIADCLDWINVVAYDFSTPTSSMLTTEAPAALYDTGNEVIHGDAGIAKWIEERVPTKKIVLGLPFYGYAWKLVNPNSHGVHAPADGPADGKANGVQITLDGTIVYNQIVDFKSKAKGVTVEFKPTYVTNICYAGKTWIGYDDVQSIQAKLKYAKNEKGLLGYFAWHVGNDYNWTLSATASSAWNEA